MYTYMDVNGTHTLFRQVLVSQRSIVLNLKSF
jgi:hypothetical protein